MSLAPLSRTPREWRLTSLLFFYLALVCIFTITAIKLTRKSHEANNRYNQIINSTLLQAEAVIKIQKQVGDLQNSVTQMLFNSSEEDIEHELAKIKQVKKQLPGEWRKLDKLLSASKLQYEYTRLLELHKKYDLGMNAVIVANQDNPLQNDVAVRLYYEDQLPSYRLFEDQLRNVSIKLAKSTQQDQESANVAVATGVIEVNVWLIGCFITIIVGLVVVSRHHRKLVTAQAETAEARRLSYEQTSRLTIQAQEEERNRISQDLHDNFGQMLSVLKLKLELVENKSVPASSISEIRENLNGVIQEVRKISHSLSNPITNNLTLNECIAGFIGSIKRATPEITYNVYLEESDKERYMSPEIKINLYRILQEIMTNALRHAEATIIEIRLLYEDEFVTLIVHDNGKGFDSKKTGSGIGMSNIQNRAEAFEGSVLFQSHPGQGCLVTVQVPYNIEARNSELQA